MINKKIIIFILVVSLIFVLFIIYKSILTKSGHNASENFVKTAQLTEGERRDKMPIFISDEKKILSFSRIPQERKNFFTEGIFTIDTNGKNQKQITKGSINCYKYFPDKEKILFVNTLNKGINIWETDIDGIDVKKLGEMTTSTLSLLKDFYFTHGVFSPNGTKIAFLLENRLAHSSPEGIENEDKNIWIMNVDGTDIKQLTKGVYVTTLSFSPKSNQIFYSVFNESAYNSSIWVVDDDGSDQKQISEVLYCPKSLSLNFDGSKLTFGVTQIWSINTDGTELKKLSDLKNSKDPSFSPDGKKIAFIHLSAEKYLSIWMMNVDGSNLKKLLTSEKFKKIDSFSFSPQGEKMVISASEDSQENWVDRLHIWIINMQQ
jgi:Tol biopolymer transport system component